MEKKGRIYQIDLFRFLAALSVVFFHYLFRGYAADNMSILNFGKIGEAFKYGYLGVDVFFIISGFVISLSIKKRSIKLFLISRFSRLYPIYWVSVFFTFIVVLMFGAPRYIVEFKQFILNLTMFHNYIGVKSIDGVYWTLFIEMKFYIFVIGTYLILNKLRRIKLDYLIYLWMTLSIIYIFFNNLFLLKVLNGFFILNWSSYFIAGMVFYQVYSNKLNLKYILLLTILFLLSSYNAILRIEAAELKYNTFFSPYIICSVIFLFFIVMLLVSCKKLNNINYSGLTKIGMLTYPLYLIHQNIGFVIFNNLGTYVNKYFLVGFTIVFMVLISYILSEFYEPKAANYLKLKLNLLFKKIKLKYNKDIE